MLVVRQGKPLMRSSAARCKHVSRSSLKFQRVFLSTLGTIQDNKQHVARGATVLTAADDQSNVTSNTEDKLLIMYTKDDCPLCQGLQDKVEGILQKANFQQSIISGYKLQVRDITTRPEWNEKYAMEVPVLARLNHQGNEVVLNRAPPRMPAARLQRFIEEQLDD